MDVRKTSFFNRIPRTESSQESACASTASEEKVLHQQGSLESVNQCLATIGESPIMKKKLQQVKYPKDKLKKIKASGKKSMLPKDESSASDDESEMIKQLKHKFQSTSKKSEKVQVLKVLPKSKKVQMNSEHSTVWYVKQKNL